MKDKFQAAENRHSFFNKSATNNAVTKSASADDAYAYDKVANLRHQIELIEKAVEGYVTNMQGRVVGNKPFVNQDDLMAARENLRFLKDMLNKAENSNEPVAADPQKLGMSR